MARYHATDQTELWKLGSRLVEGLTGEALKVAMVMGHNELSKDTAVPTLVARVKKHIFPLASAEARELYKMGQRAGTLSRQPGESMISYVERRRRWWDMLKKLDPKIDLSDTLLGELLLEHSGLSHNERMMVMTSTFNDLDFDKVAEALIKQHALRESIHGSQKGKGKGPGKGKGRAYLANEDWDGSWEEDWTSYEGEAWQASSSSYDGAEAWQASSSRYDGWESWYYEDEYPDYSYCGPDYSYYGSEYAESPQEPGTYESLFDQLSYEGANEEELAATIQEAYLAHQNYEMAEADVYYGKGNGKKGKGKGKFHHKGKGKGKFQKGKFHKGKPYGGGNLSLEDRRQKMNEFKKRTTCQACGQKGHWAGDPGCPKGNSNAATANMAIRKLSDSSDEGISLPQGKKPGVCLMLDGFDVVLEEQERDWFEEEEVAQDHGLDLTPENLEMIPGHDSKMSSAQYKGRTYSEVTCLDQEFTRYQVDHDDQAQGS